MAEFMEVSWELMVAGPIVVELLGGHINYYCSVRCVEEDDDFGISVLSGSVETSDE